MAYPLSVTELTLRVGEAPLASVGCCPPVPPTILGLDPTLDTAYGNLDHGSRRRTGNRGRPNKGSKRRNHPQRPADDVNRRGDVAAPSGGDHRTRHAAASDASGAAELPQHLLLTPFAPLPWDKMVQNRETPHFFLVPSTPVKATWLSNPDVIASLTGKRKKKKKPQTAKDGHGIERRTEDYDENYHPVENSDEVSYDYWDNARENDQVGEDARESGAPLQNKVSADVGTEDNPANIDNHDYNDGTVLNVQNILESYNGENFHSEISRHDDTNTGHVFFGETGVNTETGSANDGLEEVHSHFGSDQPLHSQGSSHERSARQTVRPHFQRVSHHRIPSTPKLTNRYQKGGKVINEDFLNPRQGVPEHRDHVLRTDEYTLKYNEDLSENQHVGNFKFPRAFDQTPYETMDYRSPTSYHIQSFPGHSLHGDSNSESDVKHDAPALSHSKHGQNILQYPQNGNDRENVNLNNDKKRHVEFTEVDAVNRNPTRFPYSNIQNNIHRQNEHVRTNFGGTIEPRIVNDGIPYPSSYTRSLSSKTQSNFPIRMNTKSSSGIINPSAEINIFQTNSHRPHMNSATEQLKNHVPEIDFGWSQDVYQSASAVHNIRFQDNPDGTQDAINLFEARFKPSTPITYIQYTTRPTTRPTTQRESIVTSKYKYNPFFQNFGPFPNMDINTDVKNLQESESQDDLVFVTPYSTNNTDTAGVEEADSGKVSTNRNGHLLNSHEYPKGVYFIQAESTTTISGIQDSERISSDDGWNVTDFSSWPTLLADGDDINEQVLNTTNDTIIDLQWGHRLSNDSKLQNENQTEYSITPTVFDHSTEQKFLEVDETVLLTNSSTKSNGTNDTNLSTTPEIVTNNVTEISSTITFSNAIDIVNPEDTKKNNTSEMSVGADGSEHAEVGASGRSAPEAHRKGGAFLDALVTLIREASSDNDSLKELLPPFSVLEVGVGESILSPDLTAEEAGSSTGAEVQESFNNSVLGPMLQIGIILGIVIIAAVLMFHSHHIRKECCSKEKKERLRQLKKRYKNSREDDLSSVELPPRPRSSNNNRKSGGHRNVYSEENTSDEDSNYARVTDVTL